MQQTNADDAATHGAEQRVSRVQKQAANDRYNLHDDHAKRRR
jgi:hypothetical protein